MDKAEQIGKFVDKVLADLGIDTGTERGGASLPLLRYLGEMEAAEPKEREERRTLLNLHNFLSEAVDYLNWYPDEPVTAQSGCCCRAGAYLANLRALETIRTGKPCAGTASYETARHWFSEDERLTREGVVFPITLRKPDGEYIGLGVEDAHRIVLHNYEAEQRRRSLMVRPAEDRNNRKEN